MGREGLCQLRSEINLGPFGFMNNSRAIEKLFRDESGIFMRDYWRFEIFILSLYH